MFDAVNRMFRSRPQIEQHIAVFGQSGSGKTTLLSTFYGWHREPSFKEKHGYSLIASDTSQGQKLLKNYLKMSEDTLPMQTRYENTEFEFSIKVNGLDKVAGSITWHDYPGEWWNETREGAERQKKVETFRKLLQSDVAFVLCDAQKIRDAQKNNNDAYKSKLEGDRYLRSLFSQLREELERQKQFILSGEQSKLKLFPRVWIICLSKADLLPEWDVYKFRNVVISSLEGELRELKNLLKSFSTDNQDYQSIGEEFLLLSSANFDLQTGKIKDHTQKIGIDLIPPIAIIVPIQKAINRVQNQQRGQSVLRAAIESCRRLTTNWMKYVPIIGSVVAMVDDGAKSIVRKLKDVETEAKEKGDAARAIAAQLRLRLEDQNIKRIYLSKE